MGRAEKASRLALTELGLVVLVLVSGGASAALWLFVSEGAGAATAGGMVGAVGIWLNLCGERRTAQWDLLELLERRDKQAERCRRSSEQGHKESEGFAREHLDHLDGLIAQRRLERKVGPEPPPLTVEEADEARLPEAELAELRELLQLSQDAIGPLDGAGWLQRAHAYHKAEMWEESERTYARAIALGLMSPTAHAGRGFALSKLDRIPEALPEFDQEVALDPDSARGHYNRGTALLRENRVEEALGAFRRANEIKPGNAHYLNNLGTALLRLDHADEALAAADESLQLRPASPKTLRLRGYALIKLGGHAAEALSALEESLEIEDDDGARAARIHMLVVLERYEVAIDAANDPIEWSSEHEEAARYNQACALARLHRFDEAIDGLRLVIELGYSDNSHVCADEDFADLRADAEYGPQFEELFHCSELSEAGE